MDFFFSRKEVKGVGRPYPVLNSVNSTLCWILICSQFIYLFIYLFTYLFVLKKESAVPGQAPPPLLLHCASANLGKSLYMHATPSASVNNNLLCYLGLLFCIPNGPGSIF